MLADLQMSYEVSKFSGNRGGVPKIWIEVNT